MAINKMKGNMYPFVTHTWNVIKGKCPHDCTYCYMKIFQQKKWRFDPKELETNLYRDKTEQENHPGKFIFVGSSCDMWHNDIHSSNIADILEHCYKYPTNTYLFQSKNPIRFFKFLDKMPPDSILCTTIETNRNTSKIMVKVNGVERPVSYAPAPFQRAVWLADIVKKQKSVTIEPIMDFDLIELVVMIRNISPEFVSIGANSKESQLGRLPEPSPAKLESLIIELRRFTNVILKDNLKRLRNNG